MLQQFRATVVTLWLWLSENQTDGWVGLFGQPSGAQAYLLEKLRIEEWVGLYGGNGYVMSSNGANKFTFGDESQKVLKVYGVEVPG